MENLIVASMAAIFAGALATWLIAQSLSDEVIQKGTRHGRYAHLGEDDVNPARRVVRRDRRLPRHRPSNVGIG